MADRALILHLNEEGLSRVEIARRVGTSHQTVSRHVLSAEEGFASIGERENYRARQKGHKSRYYYVLHTLRQRGFDSGHEYATDRIKRKGHESYQEYRDFLARQRGEVSFREQAHARYVRSLGLPPEDYKKYVARRTEQSKKLPEKLSTLIRRRLERLGKNQSWLANQIGVSRQAVSSYTNRKTFPGPKFLIKIFSALGVKGRGF